MEDLQKLQEELESRFDALLRQLQELMEDRKLVAAHIRGEHVTRSLLVCLACE